MPDGRKEGHRGNDDEKTLVAARAGAGRVFLGENEDNMRVVVC